MKIRQSLLSVFVFCFATLSLNGAPLQIKINSYNTHEEIKIIRLYDYNWVSVNDFIEKFGQDLRINGSDFVLKSTLEKKKFQIYGGSAFYRVNKVLYHFPTTTEIIGNEYFVPVNEFLKVLQSHFYPKIHYNEMENTYILEPADYSISGIDIKEFKNGSMVRILTNKTFLKKHCSLWQGTNNNGWLYFTIYGGSCDTAALKQSFPSGIIRYLEPIQSENSVQFSFKLRHSITGSEFYVEKNPSSIVINLRKPITSDLKEELLETRSKWFIDTIVLDAGHGGKDPGALGYDGTKEKDIVLDVVKRLGNLLQKNLDVKVVYTRKTDTFIPLQQRTRIANKAGGKLFLSVHCNSVKNRKISGSETYILSLEKNAAAVQVAELENKVIQFEDNQEFYDKLTSEQRILASLAQNTYMKESEALAAVIEEKFSNNLHKKYAGRSRGVKQAGFYVLVGASMPNILTEIGFISNRNDLKNLKKASYRQKVAESLYHALREFKFKHEKEVTN